MIKQYKITLILKTPLHIASGSKESRGTYSTMLKRDGLPYIPATTIKGKARHNFLLISGGCHDDDQKECNCLACRIFGTGGFYPSAVYFDDCLLEKEYRMNEEQNLVSTRYGAAINRYLKTTLDQHLYSKEVVEGVSFSGNMTIYLNDETKEYENLIKKSIEMIENIGQGKSGGLGFVNVKLEEVGSNEQKS